MREVKVSVDIDSKHEETTIIIKCKEMDDSIKSIVDFINGQGTRFLVGQKGEMRHILKPADIHYFHTANDTVSAVTATGEFRLKEKLYELEAMLAPSQFIRLSKSVIANLDEMSRFEASFNGTLCVYFKSGAKEYVSRNYVNAIKESLKMNRRKEQ